MAVGPRRQVPSKGVLAGCACAPAGAALCGGVGFLRVSRTRLACWTDVPPGPRLPFCPFLKLLEGGARQTPQGRGLDHEADPEQLPGCAITGPGLGVEAAAAGDGVVSMGLECGREG